MPISYLSPGGVYTLQQNVAYALPAVRVMLATAATNPTMEFSNVQDFSVKVANPVTNGQAECAGGFIRCTSGTIDVAVKRM